jgi:hypothetical protein
MGDSGGYQLVGLPLHTCFDSDEFISCYALTLGSLLDAYAKRSPKTVPKFTIVGVTHTNDQANVLKFVQEEVKNIPSIIKTPYVCLQGKEATG